eukprot:m.81363 g.81363  ORF g.81363 m.81363 type:complete len:310 (-) comp14872_c0_seq4:309-1238(-)
MEHLGGVPPMAVPPPVPGMVPGMGPPPPGLHMGGGLAPPPMPMPGMMPPPGVDGVVPGSGPVPVPAVVDQRPAEPASHTIRVNNLDEKIKEAQLKTNLHAIFDQFGKIVQIVAMKSLKRRGQAFIVFDTIESAVKAHGTMQGFPFSGKEMNIRFAHTESDVIAKRNGTYKQRVKPPKPPIKRKAKAPAESVKRANVGVGGAVAGGAPPGTVLPPGVRPPPSAAPAFVPPVEVPHNILFLTSLPVETTELMLSTLFNKFPGFKETRLVPSRHDIAFVEYDNELQASMAKNSLQGFKLTASATLQIAFAKK